MKKTVFSLAMVLMAAVTAFGQTPTLKDNSTSANASKNQVVITTAEYGPRYFNTDEVTGIDIDAQNSVTVKQSAGDYTYQSGVTGIKFRKASRDRKSVV